MCPRGEDLLQSWKQPWMKRVSTWSLFHVCRPRAAVAFVQCAQVLIHGSHFLVIYVDDLLAFFSRHEAPILACLCLMLAAAGQWLWEGIPVSWGKLQLADSLRFIGWEICLTSHPVAVLPDDRRAALLAALQPRRVPGAGFNRKDLRTLVGRLRWFTAGFRWLRPWPGWLCGLRPWASLRCGYCVPVRQVRCPGWAARVCNGRIWTKQALGRF